MILQREHYIWRGANLQIRESTGADNQPQVKTIRAASHTGGKQTGSTIKTRHLRKAK